MEKKTLLFINACVRGEGVSRTLGLCRGFLKEVEDRYEIIEIDLDKEGIVPMNSQILAKRDALSSADRRDDKFFDYAHQFAKADAILVGAPYWDWSFPACLKAYIERISNDRILFAYEGDSCKGLCNAKKAMYISTAGGYAGERHLGAEYIKEVFKNFGIMDFSMVCAEGIDIWGCDIEATLDKARKELVKIARAF